MNLVHTLSHATKSPALRPDCRILVTGVSSIHGWPVFQRLSALLAPGSLHGTRPPKASLPSGVSIESRCLTDRPGLESLQSSFRPTHVVHCGGVCDLDLCEERPQWARALNTDAAANIAAVFGRQCHVIYLSSDLVFSGDSPPEGGYAEEHPVDPLSVVGRTIADAEQHIARCSRHCVVRLGLPLGPSVTGDKGAVDWIGSRLRKGRRVTLFYDEFRSCITTEDIGDAVAWLLAVEATGLYHLGGPRTWSLHEVGRKVLAEGGYRSELLQGIRRVEEVGGPPRVGNIALNSTKVTMLLAQYREGAARPRSMKPMAN